MLKVRPSYSCKKSKAINMKGLIPFYWSIQLLSKISEINFTLRRFKESDSRYVLLFALNCWLEPTTWQFTLMTYYELVTCQFAYVTYFSLQRWSSNKKGIINMAFWKPNHQYELTRSMMNGLIWVLKFFCKMRSFPCLYFIQSSSSWISLRFLGNNTYFFNH